MLYVFSPKDGEPISKKNQQLDERTKEIFKGVERVGSFGPEVETYDRSE